MKLTKKAFIEELNRAGYKHRHGRYHNRVRPYGTYLYAQDRDKFNVDYAEWKKAMLTKAS